MTQENKQADQRVVCFSGQLGNGKDMAADYLAKRLNTLQGCVWQRCAFGDSVKHVFMEVWNKSREWLEEWKRKDSPPPGFNRPVRQALQFIGDGFRQIQPLIWINKLYEINIQGGLVISDGRYNTEIISVHEKNGVCVLVWRPGFENDIDHNSESQIVPHLTKLKASQSKSGPVTADGVPFDFFLVNDGTLEELYEQIDTLLVPFIRERFGI